MGAKGKKKQTSDVSDRTVLRNARLECLMEIFECFDFHKVQSVMETLKWRILIRDDMTGHFESRIPSVKELISEARRLAEECWKGIDENPEANKTGEYLIATGPFELRWDESDHSEIRATLKFVCEEWNSMIMLPE